MTLDVRRLLLGGHLIHLILVAHVVPLDVVGETTGYVVEGSTVTVLSADGEVVSVEPPPHVDLGVTETDPGLKGDTATGGNKPATLETGAEVQVPLFLNTGDKIKVDPRDGRYLGRVNK